MMKLIGTATSPYTRKVRVVLAEKRMECEFAIDMPNTEGSTGAQYNPLGKIPVLVLDDESTLFDSRVIVEYLDTLGSGPKLIPEDFESRIEVKRWEALGDGITEATVNINHEYREPAEKQRSKAWFEKQRQKIDRGLALMERDLGKREFCFGNRYTLADIAADYALDYLDFALAEVEWRKAHPALAQLAERLAARPSFSSTLQAPRT